MDSDKSPLVRLLLKRSAAALTSDDLTPRRDDVTCERSAQEAVLNLSMKKKDVEKRIEVSS